MEDSLVLTGAFLFACFAGLGAEAAEDFDVKVDFFEEVVFFAALPTLETTD